MRVTSGIFKGHLLKSPKGGNVRPTSELVKEALFAIIGEKIEDSSFLELFAGSGNVGIEALSRGAKQVVFVEKSRHCIKTIEVNLHNLGVAYKHGLSSPGASAYLLGIDTERSLTMFARSGYAFDIVFMDPPYADCEPKNCLLKINRYDILKDHSLLIVEHSRRNRAPQTDTGLSLLNTRTYGETALSFYAKVSDK
ncbi:MAG: 16S rRNA (guanine(966)-N(2))-methyltransferase RsmD [Candidatus Omnitrophota bacterium]